MTSTGSIGLVAIFLVDALNLFYISLLGQNELAAAIGYAGTLMFFTTSVAIGMTIAVGALVSKALGEEDRTLAAENGGAALLLIAIGMGLIVIVLWPNIGILRGTGDAKRAMYVTLIGGAASAVLDPLFIFGFDLEVTGAAIATVISRFVIMIVGLHGAIYVHHLVKVPSKETFASIARPFTIIAIPAVLTQLATPVGNAYVTAEISKLR
ncbi:Protein DETOXIFICATION 42 [Nymphon striatum]|nr:Protein DETOXIFICATION 42 [Nymphon striatum]